MSLTGAARPSLPMRASGYTDPAFARLADLAHLLAGLVFPSNRQPSAEAGMRRAMTALRIREPAQLLRAAETPGPSRDIILAELTVGESYFFRDEVQLGLLGAEILPARAKAADAGRPLRIWSAGCASGEEAYTIMILLRELGWPRPAQILGTDIALPRLAAARRGRYTRWALRGVSDERVARWFTRHATSFDVAAEVRDAVEFGALNLVTDTFTSDATAAGGYDLVLCRNVMIYFDLPTVARVATGLLDTLAEDGWLVLGASDPPLAHLVPCEAVMTPTGMAYRRVNAERAAERIRVSAAVAVPEPTEWRSSAPAKAVAVAVPFAPVRPVASRTICSDAADAVRAAYERADYAAAESGSEIALACEPDSSESLPLWVFYLRAVANQGRLHEAGALCVRALELHPLAAELHYLHATLLASADWHADAATAARRAIYLDRGFVMGHMLLGDALARTGDVTGARRAFENVIASLGKSDPATPVVAADGVTASRLRQVAESHLRALGAGVPA